MNKNISYAIIALGVIVLIAGAVIKFATTHHHGVEAMIAGVVVAVIGIVLLVVVKPKAA